ncbi:MAG: Gfo/Idh/MocA family oxidoreductase [Thermoplasmata archaeon]|uniref:Gfo/Idh/MocA family oxidoreductase n=1 Tax=Candidatus Sysuiplasma superficiale TaxID=2823368 RepID=A0A8J7YRR0_9ARCH|nr:Gfo/Idh/MocA family oxidoreductase [Candidatus Sysuiplasma superficiale]MBX8643996.1 Gfo/Idh/MocA family oxidoreductase [Candidatus Sysuiplasma superficiale]
MKVLVLGARGFAKIHLDSLSRLGVDISVFDRNQEALNEARNDYSIADTYSDLGEALSSDAEVVDIVLPHNLHRDVSVTAFRKGKHVLIEKPIATTVHEAEEMVALAKQAGVKFMVSEQYYFDTTARWVIDAVEAGKIGKLITVVIRDQRLYQKNGWRSRKDLMGGGALIDGGIHFVDTMLNIGGEYSNVKSSVYHGCSSLEGEDTSVAILDFKNGAHGLLLYTWSYPFSPKLPSFEVIGSEGSIVEDIQTHPKVDFKYMTGKRYAFGMPVLNGKTVELELEDVFDRAIGGFIESVETGGDVPMKPELAIRDLSCVMDIYEKGNHPDRV